MITVLAFLVIFTIVFLHFCDISISFEPIILILIIIIIKCVFDDAYIISCQNFAFCCDSRMSYRIFKKFIYQNLQIKLFISKIDHLINVLTSFNMDASLIHCHTKMLFHWKEWWMYWNTWRHHFSVCKHIDFWVKFFSILNHLHGVVVSWSFLLFN